MEFQLKEIRVEELYLIKGLWEKLNHLHQEDSKFFKEHYASNTFEKRCEKFLTLDPVDIRIEVVESLESQIIGYCISTVSHRVGEIESLFIEQAYRQQELGKLLVSRGTQWLKDCKCDKIQVSVADGHESVFDFYKKQGFYPRLTYLELKIESEEQNIRRV